MNNRQAVESVTGKLYVGGRGGVRCLQGSKTKCMTKGVGGEIVPKAVGDSASGASNLARPEKSRSSFFPQQHAGLFDQDDEVHLLTKRLVARLYPS